MSAEGGSAGAGGGSGSGSGAAHASRVPPVAPGGNDGAAPPYDVFISYAREDGMEVAALLEDGLTHRGLRVWRDETSLHLGDTLSSGIGRGLDNSSHAVAVISPAYADKRWTMIELGGMMYGGLRGRIIPVLHKTDYEYVASNLPMLADRLAGTWDDDAEHLMDKIVHAAKIAPEGPRAPADRASGGGYTADMDLLAVASAGAAAGISKEISGSTISRDEQVAAVERLLESGGRVAIVGGKGSGKSVLSCLLYERLAARGTALLVRCDDFPDAGSAGELDGAIVPGRSLVDLTRSVARSQPGAAGGMTIVFDSLDAAGRNERTMRAFRRLLKMVWGAGARTVVTVRSCDCEHSSATKTTDWGEKYELEALSDDEVGGILGKLGNPAVPPGLKKLLSSPLNLHLFSLVVKKSPGADLAPIGSEIDLYDAHWHHYVEMEPLGERVRDELYDVAEEMLRGRKTLAPYAPGDPEAAARAQSSGILVRTRDGGCVRYFHHAYLDYAVSRALLERHQPLEEYMCADERNVSLRPALPPALAMAHRRDPGKFASAVEEMLLADIKYHWKIAALASLASVAPEGGGAYAGLEAPLTDQPVLQRHFLVALARRRNASWLRAWGGPILAWASDPRNPNGLPIVDYLRAAAAADGRCHGRAFAVAAALAENSADGRVREGAVASLAGIDADGKDEWLEAASGSGDPRVRAGVARNLPRLLERRPDLVPGIFCSLYAHGEAPGEGARMPGRGPPPPPPADAGYLDGCEGMRDLGGMFPRLLEANPLVMVRAAVLAAERANCDALSGPGPGLADDGPRRRGRAASCVGGDPVLDCVGRYAGRCSDEEFARLAPLLEGTKLASFRGMLIGGMAGRGRAFLGMLAGLLADPRVHGVHMLGPTVRDAIGAAWGHLDEGQRRRILEAAARPAAPSGEPLRAAGASPPFPAPPAAAPPAPPPPAAGGPSGPGAADAAPDPHFAFLHVPSEETAGLDPVVFIAAMLDPDMGPDMDRASKISLLGIIRGVLDGRPGALDGDLADPVASFLIEASGDECPGADGEAAGGPGGAPPPAAADSVRRLAAECLVRIAARRRGGAVLDAVRRLSEDPAGDIRRGVAGSLVHLLQAHYGEARRMAMYYSRDPDDRVRSLLPAVLHRIARRDPAAASAMMANMLEPPARPPDGIAPLLVWLALVPREPRAAGLLRRIAGEGAFSSAVRAEIPPVLGGAYLASADHMDDALGLLRALLDDSDREVRRRAAFSVLGGLGGNPAVDSREYIGKIAPHLGRMSSMLEETPPDLGIAAALAGFMEMSWREAPETALALLEKTADMHGIPAASEPAVAGRLLGVLAGLLQHHSLYDGEWNRCLDVLDKYAAVGWPAALDLLAGMGERD